MSVKGVRRIDPPRALTPQELRLLGFMLTADFVGRDALLQQADLATVRGECTCGCRTVDLHVPIDKALRAHVRSSVPVSAHDSRDQDRPVEVLLHVENGYLSELEIVEYGEDTIGIMPDPAHLELWSPHKERLQGDAP